MKSVPKLHITIVLMIMLVLSLACRTQVGLVETPEPVNAETLVAATMSVYTQQVEMSPVTAAVEVTVTPEVTSTSAPADAFGNVYVYTNVDNVNLRVNPGLLFKVSRVLPKGTKLDLLGQAPGGEWFYVRNSDGVQGWVYGSVLIIAYDGPRAPTIEPTDVYLVTGTVLTELGTPVSGIGYAVIQGQRRTDAHTDETGHFYVYLPPNMSGVWTVSLVSIACTSNTMDSNCNCIGGRCGTSFPESVFVELPQKEVLNFVWK